MTTNTPSPWRQIQRQNITQIKVLMDYLKLSTNQRRALLKAPRFPLNLPLRLAQKIQKETLNDPILKQFVPLTLEQNTKAGFNLDPVQDGDFKQTSRLLKKYKYRALLLTTSACAMHCRYCFRQNNDYGEKVDFKKEIELIKQDTSIHEVILSGGDPLSLSNEDLNYLLNQIEEIPHIKQVRFHSRFIIGIPERVDEGFLKLLDNRKYKIFFILHINHPTEIDNDIIQSITKLQKLGIPTLNQAVLLSGVNDCLETQLELHQALINSAIIPYYLHQLDQIDGGMHFEVQTSMGKKIIDYLRSHLPGYAVPQYVQEIPHKKNKTPIT